MADFYTQMAGVAAALLSPTSQGGLGQGNIILTRSEPGVADPEKPWIPVQPTRTSETLKGAAKGVSSKLVGVEVGGTVILASDREVIATVPKMTYKAGDTLSIDGVPVVILQYSKIPAAGIASAVKFIVRGG